MTYTPPPTPPPRDTRRSRTWIYLLAALAILIVLYFVFFAAGPVETPTIDGTDGTAVEGGATPTTPAPAN